MSTSSRLEHQTGTTTIVALLQERARRQPDQIAFTFLVDGEAEEQNLTYSELDRQARSIAAFLSAKGLSGQRALLAYPPGLDYVTAFLGCLYAGVIAVPIYPPKTSRPDLRFAAVMRDSQAAVVLTTADVLAEVKARPQGNELTQVAWYATDGLDPASASSWQPGTIAPEDVAFLQYTSGSTALPKGVMVTHCNVMANVQMIASSFAVPDTGTHVSWLPLFHDMGLIGSVLAPIYKGYRSVMMSPMAFLQRPIRWLQALTRYRGTATSAPNFAYDLCARKVRPDQLAELDLSSLQVAICGAEPVRPQTIERFTEHFAPAGFRREAFCPSFGLAEATLLVSASSNRQPPTIRYFDRAELGRRRVVERAADDHQGQPVVGCGRPAQGVTVRIVDPETGIPCREGQVGEIWVAGANIAKGYWNRPEETARTFGARLDHEGEGPFLRTGDLGFFLDGELYITGRIKDLIIIRGQNHYPPDIEWTVTNSHAGLRPDGAAAFGVESGGEEHLVVVAEIERQARKGNLLDIVASIRTALVEHHGLQAHGIVLVPPGGIPRTSSGKIQRSACREAFLSRTLPAVCAVIQGRLDPDWKRNSTADPDDQP